jgi:hypothetical protein
MVTVCALIAVDEAHSRVRVAEWAYSDDTSGPLLTKSAERDTLSQTAEAAKRDVVAARSFPDQTTTYTASDALSGRAFLYLMVLNNARVHVHVKRTGARVEVEVASDCCKKDATRTTLTYDSVNRARLIADALCRALMHSRSDHRALTCSSQLSGQNSLVY